MHWTIPAGIVAAYLIGSFSSALWLGKWLTGKDIRQFGSGNAGFANAMRVFGPSIGIPVLLIDAGKGYLAVVLARALPESVIQADSTTFWQLIFGFSAMIGHIFPVYSKFKGGKAVATGLGVILAVFPLGAGLSLASFLVVLGLTRYVSLSSLTGGLTFPLWVTLFPVKNPHTMTIFGVVVAILLLVTHRENIGRLVKGTERKAFINRKKHHADDVKNKHIQP